MMCHKRCQCNDNDCDPHNGECLTQNAKIIFDVTHNRSTSVMKTSPNRIKARHWIPINGNGKINFRNCSKPDQCEPFKSGHIVDGSTVMEDRNNINKSALIKEMNLSNSTNELEVATDRSVVVVKNTTIAIHHVHKNVKSATDSTKNVQKDLLSASTEVNYIETDNQDMNYDRYDEAVEGVGEGENDLEDSDEIDGIGGYNDIVHVFAMSSINTTKSVNLILKMREADNRIGSSIVKIKKFFPYRNWN